MSAQDNAAVVRAGTEAYNNRDWDKAIALATPDIEVVFEATGQTFYGHDGLLQFNQGWANAFPDSRLTITNALTDDKRVADEFAFEGTHTGTLVTPAGEIPPTGRSVHGVGARFFELESGKISRLHIYSDVLTLMQQLGVAPTPEQARA